MTTEKTKNTAKEEQDSDTLSENITSSGRSVIKLLTDLRQSFIESRLVGVDMVVDKARDIINDSLEEQKSLSKEKSNNPILNLREGVSTAFRQSQTDPKNVHEKMIDKFKKEFDKKTKK